MSIFENSLTNCDTCSQMEAVMRKEHTIKESLRSYSKSKRGVIMTLKNRYRLSGEIMSIDEDFFWMLLPAVVDLNGQCNCIYCIPYSSVVFFQPMNKD